MFKIIRNKSNCHGKIVILTIFDKLNLKLGRTLDTPFELVEAPKKSHGRVTKTCRDDIGDKSHHLL